jgi:hypothetical protein
MPEVAGTECPVEMGGGETVAQTTFTAEDRRAIAEWIRAERLRLGLSHAELPKAKFYEVDIGQHKGPSYSFAELERNEWTISLEVTE